MTRIEHKTLLAGCTRSFLLIAAAAALLVTTASRAAIPGIPGGTGTINMTATDGYISVSDGGSIYSWGYTTTGTMQLPGPTIIVTEGQTVTIELTNDLPLAAGNVSIVFPGNDVATSGGVAGELTQEAAPGGTVTYSFVAGRPGTYQYHSGTRPDLQVEMGLYGALIVEPLMAGCAYNHADSCYDREYLFLLSEIDLDVHEAAEAQIAGDLPIVLPAEARVPEYWLMNGRAAPDTMAADFSPTLPTQPYNAVTNMHPGEKLLLRVIGAGHQMHPFHTHGNHARLLARDGRMLTTGPDGTGSLAGPLLFTIPSLPGATADAIFEWTGEGLGWDIYGHTDDTIPCIDTDLDGFDDDNLPAGTGNNQGEWCADHMVPIPVDLPALSSMAFGGFYSGSPFLGLLGSLPPGEGGLNPDAGFAYMWHSHTERELVNNDVFPGGMMTMLIVQAPWVGITE